MRRLIEKSKAKLSKRGKKLSARAIKLCRKTEFTAKHFSSFRHARAMGLPLRWHEETTRSLSHMVMPEYPVEPSIILNEQFPKLAWQLRLSEEEHTVKHGAGVETKDGSIFEGVWNGDFEAFDFDQSDYVFGSGLKTGRTITITPPSHMFECVFLFYNHATKELIASNSMACGLSALPEAIHAQWLSTLSEVITARNNAETARGLFSYKTKIVEIGDWEMHWLYSHNFTLEPKNPVSIDVKSNLFQLSNFEEYRETLIGVMKGVLDNGRSAKRKKKLSPATCISTGYDSTAVTALGKQIGINNAFTLDINVNGISDCGVDVAEELNTNCRVFSHPAGQKLDSLKMAYDEKLLVTAREFIGTVGFGDDILYAAFEEFLPNTMMFDGKAGDSVWDKDSVSGPGLPITAPYSKSLNEFRLRVGFAHIPAPAIAAEFPEILARINRQDDMKPYSIGGDYDRPLPRRFAEEAGAHRNSFGQKKRAANPHPLNFDELKHSSLKAMLDRYTSA